jgi:1-aminocyclopropane-1-carboxylate deaminase
MDILSDKIWNVKTPIQQLNSRIFQNHNVECYLIREDLNHKHISGNKLRKLKYNLDYALKHGYTGILTFGGAFSNHIAATAYACDYFGINSIGIIRGEYDRSNETLESAEKNGMHFEFISRTDYRKKEDEDFLQKIENRFPEYFIVPEGGDNQLGIDGCAEIIDNKLDVYAVACGTGNTLKGLIKGSLSNSSLIGIPVLKGDFILKDINEFCRFNGYKEIEISVFNDYHFGGYAKTSAELLSFIHQFYLEHSILLDPIYTSKLLFGMYDLIKMGIFDNKKIGIIHTGGLQGWKGYTQLRSKLISSDFLTIIQGELS